MKLSIIKKCTITGIAVMTIISMFSIMGCSKESKESDEDSANAIVDTDKLVKDVLGNETAIENGVVVYTGDDNSNKEVIQYGEPEKGDLIATIKVKGYGQIKVRFFPEQAPLAVENFVQHAKDGYYDGVSFHRVIEEFMIQGGDPKGTGSGGESIWKDEEGNAVPFEDEFSKYLIPMRGALCMANSGANTNGSQFFIVQSTGYNISDVISLMNSGVDHDLIAYYKENGGACWLYEAHTVFGQVVEGYDVLDSIATAKTDGSDAPVVDVIIEGIEFSEY